MRYFFAFSIFLIFATGCSRNNRQPRILAKDEMGKVSWDIMLVDQYINSRMPDSTHDINKDRLRLYLKVFQLHHITREDYNASLKYYMAKPDLMKTIFDTLAVKSERLRYK